MPASSTAPCPTMPLLPRSPDLLLRNDVHMIFDHHNHGIRSESIVACWWSVIKTKVACILKYLLRNCPPPPTCRCTYMCRAMQVQGKCGPLPRTTAKQREINERLKSVANISNFESITLAGVNYHDKKNHLYQMKAYTWYQMFNVNRASPMELSSYLRIC